MPKRLYPADRCSSQHQRAALTAGGRVWCQWDLCFHGRVHQHHSMEHVQQHNHQGKASVLWLWTASSVFFADSMVPLLVAMIPVQSPLLFQKLTNHSHL